MVCHEAYKDSDGNWLYPNEISKIDTHTAIKISDKSKVSILPPESMSKSKKNTIDPEIMIKKYGADSIRWFILSDSPPEKDVQWSDTGVSSASKFLQKFWNLNIEILSRKNREEVQSKKKKFSLEIENLISKIDQNINEFKFNVSIALFYETYKVFSKSLELEINNQTLKSNMIKILKIMIPFVPHLAYECLEQLDEMTEITWPKIDSNLLTEINFAVQINGKTRDVIKVKKDETETELNKLIKNKSKAAKYLKNNNIKKTIFIKNKIINYIV